MVHIKSLFVYQFCLFFFSPDARVGFYSWPWKLSLINLDVRRLRICLLYVVILHFFSLIGFVCPLFTDQSKCVPNPCLNDGTCRDVDIARGYVCYCSIAYLGPNCESECWLYRLLESKKGSTVALFISQYYLLYPLLIEKAGFSSHYRTFIVMSYLQRVLSLRTYRL